MGIYSEAFYKHWILFPTVWHLPRLCQGRTQWKAKCGKNRLKTLIHFTTRHRYIAISQKWLKIDWYMQRVVLQALNPLSNRVTFTFVPGVYLGEAKMCKKCAKMANFWTYWLNYWETVEDRWVYAAMRLTSIESSFHPCDIYCDCPRGGQNVHIAVNNLVTSAGHILCHWTLCYLLPRVQWFIQLENK